MFVGELRTFYQNKWLFYSIPFNGSCFDFSFKMVSCGLLLKTKKQPTKENPCQWRKTTWLTIRVCVTPDGQTGVSDGNSNSDQRGCLHITQDADRIVS